MIILFRTIKNHVKLMGKLDQRNDQDWQMGINARKPVFGVSDHAWLD